LDHHWHWQLLGLLYLPRPPPSTLFPYTTLFRSQPLWTAARPGGQSAARLHRGAVPRERGYPHLPRLAGRDIRPHVRRDVPYGVRDRKSTRLNSSHGSISYAVFCLKKKSELANCM